MTRVPKLIVMLSEVWTMTSPRDLPALVELAAVAEKAGADGVLVGEHVVMGPNAGVRGTPANPRDWIGEGTQNPRDPHPSNLEVLAAMAARTTTLRLLAAGLLSPLRHPLVVGKQLATLDLLSRGRLVVMPTVSWQEEEYAALGVPFRARGEILDEQLAIWSRVWREDVVSHKGRHFSFDDVYFEPKPWSASSPAIWFGGPRLHPRALRRVVRHATGYLPLTPPSEEQIELLEGALAEADRSLDEIEIAIPVGTDTPFPSDSAPKSLAVAIDAALPALDRGVSTFVLKPSQYIDDAAQLGDLCRDAIRRLDGSSRRARAVR